MSRRSVILTELATILSGVTGITTVKLVNNIEDKYPIDLLDTELPAVKIIVPEESVQYETNMHAMNRIRPELHLYAIDWSKDSITAEEDALEALRNALGENYNISGTAINIDILKVFKEKSTYPITHFRVLCEIIEETDIRTV